LPVLHTLLRQQAEQIEAEIDVELVLEGQRYHGAAAVPLDLAERTGKMRFIGRETIKIRNGKYRCLKFQPMVQKGRIFKSNDDLNVWISDDPNHVPILVQAKILVGSIKMELSGYEGLANPIAKE
ncbi:MAG TPA: DUF3108 domain-containing protein, partial [Flavobacteriales bacterium]|nr:DUF3108 domain-containing protein [Flavobacteriales bacterium]